MVITISVTADMMNGTAVGQSSRVADDASTVQIAQALPGWPATAAAAAALHDGMNGVCKLATASESPS